MYALAVIVLVFIAVAFYATERYEGVNHVCKTYPATPTSPESRTCEWRLVRR